MRLTIASTLAFLLAGLLIQPALAQQGAGRGGVTAERVIRALDANGDGRVTRDEIPASRQRMRDNFDRLDRDGDGSLSVNELDSVMRRARQNEPRQRNPQPVDAAQEPATTAQGVTASDIANATPVPLPPASNSVASRTITLYDAERRKDIPLTITFPVESGRYPVLLFSPYLGGVDAGYERFAKFLAGQGYVFVLLGHEESVSSESRTMQQAMGSWQERPRDLRFVLDNLAQLERDEPRLEGKLDADAVAAAGHLIGAYASSFLVGARTTTGETFVDDRVKAALLLGGQGRSQLMDENSWRAIDAPMMVVAGSEHPSRRTGNPATWRTEPFVFSEAPDKYLVYVQGMDGRFGGLFPGEGDQYQGQVNEGLESYVLAAIVDFLDAHLAPGFRAGGDPDQQRLEIASNGIVEVSTKSAAAVAAAYVPVDGSYPVGVDGMTVLDPDRQREIPLRIYAPDIAPPASGWPAVVFSHGLGESRDSYGYLGEALAANGYAVMFMSHEGSDAESFRRSGYQGLNTVDNAQAKTADMHFVIQKLADDDIANPLLSGRVEARRIAAAGQCAGSSIASVMAGLTAMMPGNGNFASRDPNVKALFLLGPQVPTELAQPNRAGGGSGLDMLKADSWEAIDVPSLVVAGERDFLWFDGIKRQPRHRLIAYDSMRSGEKYLVDLAGGGHHAFTDSEPWYRAGPRNPMHHEWIAASVVAFLDAYLQDDQTALAWLQSDQLEAISNGQAHQEHVSERRAGPATAHEKRATSPLSAGEPVTGFYAAARGPFDIRVVDNFVLRDGGRGKDLNIRITYPVGEGPFPVIAFSHGAWASNELYQPLIEHWSSHGYVTLQPNHADSRALGVTIGDQSVFRDWEARPNDIAFMLDSLDDIAREVRHLNGRIDVGSIGVAGHSFGAHTAQLIGGARINDPRSGRTTSFKDARVDAVLLMSPQGRGYQLDESAWNDIDAPLMTMTGSNDIGRKGQGISWRVDPFVYAGSRDKHLLFINGAYHNFGGATGVTASSKGGENPDFVRYVLSASTAFWDGYLKDSPDARHFLAADAFERLTGGEATVTSRPDDVDTILQAAPAAARPRRR